MKQHYQVQWQNIIIIIIIIVKINTDLSKKNPSDILIEVFCRGFTLQVYPRTLDKINLKYDKKTLAPQIIGFFLHILWVKIILRLFYF